MGTRESHTALYQRAGVTGRWLVRPPEGCHAERSAASAWTANAAVVLGSTAWADHLILSGAKDDRPGPATRMGLSWQYLGGLGWYARILCSDIWPSSRDGGCLRRRALLAARRC